MELRIPRPPVRRIRIRRQRLKRALGVSNDPCSPVLLYLIEH